MKYGHIIAPYLSSRSLLDWSGLPEWSTNHISTSARVAYGHVHQVFDTPDGVEPRVPVNDVLDLYAVDLYRSASLLLSDHLF